MQTMDDVEAFLQNHQGKLLRYLDGKAPQSPGEPRPLEYVEQVLAEWSRTFAGRKINAPCRKERTFWFALYQFEELVENPINGQPCSYESVLLHNLAQVKEILRSRGELPEEFFATRPGEAFEDAF